MSQSPDVDPPPPPWWMRVWADFVAAYPGVNLPPESGRVYWSELNRRSERVVREGIRLAKAASTQFFPPAPLVAEQCRTVADRLEREADSARLQAEHRERERAKPTSRNERLAAAYGFMASHEDMLYHVQRIGADPENELLVLYEMAKAGELPKRPQLKIDLDKWGPPNRRKQGPQ